MTSYEKFKAEVELAIKDGTIIARTATDDIWRAAKLANIAHEGQMRTKNKDGRARPYRGHLVRVAAAVSVHQNLKMIAAAHLHDTLEDTDVTYDELVDGFGIEIANIVQELTNKFTKKSVPDINRYERKRREAIRLSEISPMAKIIKLADRYDNVTDLDPTSDFAKTYYAESINLAVELMMPNDKGLNKDINAAVNKVIVAVKMAKRES